MHLENYHDKACGPIMNALHTCTKYGLPHFILNGIESANYCTIRQWKKLTYVVIQQTHVQKWTVTKPKYKSQLYMDIDLCSMLPWWHNAHKCPSWAQQSRLIIQLLLNKDQHQHDISQC